MEFKNDYVLGFLFLRDSYPVIALQDWVGWGIFTVIPGYPRRANGDSQHFEARPELQDWLRFELFTVKKLQGQGRFPWKLKPGFINRVLVAVIFGGLEMPLEIVFLEPQNWRPLKPHY